MSYNTNYNPYFGQQPQAPVNPYSQQSLQQSMMPYLQQQQQLLQQQPPSYQQQPQQLPQQPTPITNVTCYEEVVATKIPLDGSVSIFTDYGHNCIYTKQLNMTDGTGLIKTYVLGDNPANRPAMQPVVNTDQFATKQEVEELKQIIAQLMQPQAKPTRQAKQPVQEVANG